MWLNEVLVFDVTTKQIKSWSKSTLLPCSISYLQIGQQNDIRRYDHHSIVTCRLKAQVTWSLKSNAYVRSQKWFLLQVLVTGPWLLLLGSISITSSYWPGQSTTCSAPWQRYCHGQRVTIGGTLPSVSLTTFDATQLPTKLLRSSSTAQTSRNSALLTRRHQSENSGSKLAIN